MKRIGLVCSEAFFWLAALGLIVLVCTFVYGCAGSSSEITPAMSDATDKTVKVTAPAKRRYHATITTPAKVPDEVDATEKGEDK